MADKKVLKIEFDNPEALHHFALWLCEAGEQEYWNWMELREETADGDITAVQFNYHGPKELTERKWLVEDTIITECGRLDTEE